MLEYARWKYILVAVVLLLALLFALPNVFGEDPALQVERKDHSPVTQDAARAVESFLGERRVHFARSYIDGGRLMVRFGGVADQLAARDAVNERFADTYRTALSFAPRTPELLRAVGLRPMPLGLDLRGGLYLLYQVDVNAAAAQAIEGYAQDARRAPGAANLPVEDGTADAVGAREADAARGFRLEDMQNNAFEAMQTGRVPLGSKLYTHTRLGRPILLKREVIATGDQLTNATTGQSQEGPAVNVRLDARAGESMLKTTRANVNKRMAVVLIEKRRETSDVNGRKVTRDVTDEEVINDATIRGIFSNNFQITGLAAGEARELALLLRSGSLAIPLYPIEERAVGPSLGRDNIDKGVTALIVGMAGVFVFMAIYYKTFGLVADAVLLSNVVLLTALLSMMRASLSLPGIAGIILTVGMAVDANVLIYERIREELRKGVTPQAAIRAGFEKAFSAIADSNITTLIAGVVLWVFGTGPIRGFAVVLTLGIATSMFTSLMGSRALLTLMYGGRRKLARLSI